MLRGEYLVGIILEDSVKRGMCEAKQRRLLRSDEGRGKGQAWWSPIVLGLVTTRLR